MKQTANQDIRDYMADHGVTQMMLAQKMGVKLWKVNAMLKAELCSKDKEDIIRHIDAIEHDAIMDAVKAADMIQDDEIEEAVESKVTEEVSLSTKYQIGDRVKVPSKSLCIGIVADIWHSLVQDKLMYAVDLEGGNRGLYSENQLEPAPIPTTYTWDAYIDGNVAVVAMIATQGEKQWVYARGHAHIIHDGEVGMAQAISYAARRMFESLDSQQENKIYVKGESK